MQFDGDRVPGGFWGINTTSGNPNWTFWNQLYEAQWLQRNAIALFVKILGLIC